MDLDLEKLKDPLIQKALKRKIGQVIKDTSEKELEKYIFRLAGIFGFGFMELNPLLDLVLDWVEREKEGDKKSAFKLERLAESLNIYYFKWSDIKRRRNDKEYWDIYIAVEEEKERIGKSGIKERSFATSEACRKIAKKLDMEFNTVRARYNDKKREAKENGLSYEDVKELITKL